MLCSPTPSNSPRSTSATSQHWTMSAGGPGSRSKTIIDGRRLVLAQALERRVAQHAVGREVGELDLADQQRLDPLRAARAGLGRQRAALHAQRPQPPGEVLERPVGEPGADLAAVDELA